MEKRFLTLSGQLQVFESEIARLEGKILDLEQRIETLIAIERNHLIRVKNKEIVPDEFIAAGRTYQDLSPEKAWKLYSDKDFDFILIDVSSKEFTSKKRIPESIHIPWEDFQERFVEIQSKVTPILFISEDGTTSVLACEFMVKRGFFNCNNISGGYKHWIGAQVNHSNNKSA